MISKFQVWRGGTRCVEGMEGLNVYGCVEEGERSRERCWSVKSEEYSAREGGVWRPSFRDHDDDSDDDHDAQKYIIIL